MNSSLDCPESDWFDRYLHHMSSSPPCSADYYGWICNEEASSALQELKCHTWFAFIKIFYSKSTDELSNGESGQVLLSESGFFLARGFFAICCRCFLLDQHLLFISLRKRSDQPFHRHFMVFFRWNNIAKREDNVEEEEIARTWKFGWMVVIMKRKLCGIPCSKVTTIVGCRNM